MLSRLSILSSIISATCWLCSFCSISLEIITLFPFLLLYHLQWAIPENIHSQWAIPENIHSPLWTTLIWLPKNVRISKKDSSSLFRIPNPADSNSWGIPQFCKILNGFPGIPVKIDKIFGKFMEFQSGSPSIYYRISNVVQGCVWIFSGIAQCILSLYFFNHIVPIPCPYLLISFKMSVLLHSDITTDGKRTLFVVFIVPFETVYMRSCGNEFQSLKSSFSSAAVTDNMLTRY